MTGGLGFVKDGMNSHRKNRKMLSDLQSNHFKQQRPKSDFSKKYNQSNTVDKNTLESIRNKANAERRENQIKNIVIITISVIIVVVIYFLPKLLES
jgi:hypothetical protein